MCSELVVVGGVFDKQDEFYQILSDHQDLGAVSPNFLAYKPTSQFNFYWSQIILLRTRPISSFCVHQECIENFIHTGTK